MWAASARPLPVVERSSCAASTSSSHRRIFSAAGDEWHPPSACYRRGEAPCGGGWGRADPASGRRCERRPLLLAAFAGRPAPLGHGDASNREDGGDAGPSSSERGDAPGPLPEVRRGAKRAGGGRLGALTRTPSRSVRRLKAAPFPPSPPQAAAPEPQLPAFCARWPSWLRKQLSFPEERVPWGMTTVMQVRPEGGEVRGRGVRTSWTRPLGSSGQELFDPCGAVPSPLSSPLFSPRPPFPTPTFGAGVPSLV